MKWQRFLDSLDTGGGHILLLVVGVAAGAFLAIHSGAEVGKTVIVGAGGALLPLLRSKNV
jgi:hypothetical protein